MEGLLLVCVEDWEADDIDGDKMQRELEVFASDVRAGKIKVLALMRNEERADITLKRARTLLGVM